MTKRRMAFLVLNQANVWKACHIGISAHGAGLWRTQEISWINFVNRNPSELIDLQEETLHVMEVT